MASVTPIIQSVNSGGSSTGKTLAVAFPSGLTAGDEMLMVITWYATAARTLTAPSGWTLVKSYDDGTIRFQHVVYRKTADSTDVSNGGITLSWSGSIIAKTYGVLRITGQALGSEITASEIDNGSSGTTTVSYTSNIAPAQTNSLIIQTGGGADTTGPVRTISGWNTTPSVTMTEQVDAGVIAGISENAVTGIAAGAYSGTSTFTSRGFITSTAFTSSNRQSGTLIIYNPVTNETGTPSPLNVSPSFFTATGLVGGSAVLPPDYISPTFFDVTGEALQPTPWTTTPKS